MHDGHGIGRSQPIRPRFQHQFRRRQVAYPPCRLDLQALCVLFDESDRLDRCPAGGMETCGSFNEVAATFADGAAAGNDRIAEGDGTPSNYRSHGSALPR